MVALLSRRAGPNSRTCDRLVEYPHQSTRTREFLVHVTESDMICVTSISQPVVVCVTGLMSISDKFLCHGLDGATPLRMTLL